MNFSKRVIHKRAVSIIEDFENNVNGSYENFIYAVIEGHITEIDYQQVKKKIETEDAEIIEITRDIYTDGIKKFGSRKAFEEDISKATIEFMNSEEYKEARAQAEDEYMRKNNLGKYIKHSFFNKNKL